MPETPYEDVYVKAVAITRGDAILTVYNDNWGAYSVPMTKPRLKPDPKNPKQPVEESAVETAIRVVVEAIGRPLRRDEVPRQHPAKVLETYHQSRRDGIWKLYHTELFHFELPAADTVNPLGGVSFAWMTLEQMKACTPISIDAETIAQALKDEKTKG